VTTKDAVDATEVDETAPETVTDEPVDEVEKVDDAATETETQSEKRDGISRRSAGVVVGQNISSNRPRIFCDQRR